VGKIGVDDAILKKPGVLTPEEFEVMKTHTTRGAAIMSEIPKMKEILPGLRSHHERWKGGGYPDGLSGEQIPLMARIIAVADTFDAMTTDRPYQRAMTLEAAHARINQLKGVALDERVVEAFNRAFLSGEIRSDTRAVAAAG
jgi:HD-GYP domain-containing protein (c-di-GMP phosphodiesterase class II)